MSTGEVASRRALATRWIMARRARVLIVTVASLTAVFLALATYLERAAGTPLDISITLFVQRIDLPGFGPAMWLVSAPGFSPVSYAVFALAVGGFWFAGLRREVWFILASLGASLISGAAKLLVARPRPDSSLVQVASELLDFSFPSGHVTSYVSLFGFLFFLFYVLFRGYWWRSLGLIVFGTLVLFVGISRIHLGHHWFSDVVGGYALGSAYLFLLIEIYTLTSSKTSQPPTAPSTEPVHQESEPVQEKGSNGV